MMWLKKTVKFGLWLAFLGSLAGILLVAGLYFHLEPKLPSTTNLKSVQFQVPLRVYSQDQKLIAEFGEKRRIPLTYQELPQQLVEAFLAAEDDRFFYHPGVDYKGLLRAAYQLITTGERRQGGSTITMQVARNFYLSREKTFTRKINEILLSLRIENELSKEEILELYLNKIYMGNRAYGVGAAAKVYYGKDVAELTLPEIAMIAGLPKAPSRYNPIAGPERALQRRNYVIGRMLQLGFITQEQAEPALNAPITAQLYTAQSELEAPYVAEMVRAEIVERFGDEAYTEGYSVTTTLHSKHQAAANKGLREALQAYDMRHGYRGPERNFDTDPSDTEQLDTLLQDLNPVAGLRPGIVTQVEEQSASVYLGAGEIVELDWDGISWALPYINENRRGPKPTNAGKVLKPGDLVRVLSEPREGKSHHRLAQIPKAESAFVSLDPNTGAILSLVGGYDFYQSKFNRATQAKRQPGSGFKAIIYSAALEAGFTPASLINDAPVVFDDPSLEATWRPENYSGKFFGPTRLRYALTKSRNLVSIRLLRSMGIKHALQHAEKFGFNPDELPHDLSLALGSGAVSPLQMASAYAVLANGGYRIEPYFIQQITNNQGDILYQANPAIVCDPCSREEQPQADASLEGESAPPRIAERVISEQNHFLMNSMMRDVINFGTARRAKSLGRNDLAGKTGTTNDQKDAWFNGFNDSLVAIAWVGFDSSEPLGKGEVGGRVALPAWMAYMRTALAGVPEKPLKVPDGIVTVRIDPTTGQRAAIEQSDAIFEVFRSENAPKTSAILPGTRNGTLGGGGTPADEPIF